MSTPYQQNDGGPVFVFGSNLAGRHGKGAALHALKKHGAVYGQGIGRQGNSYGIPTKDRSLRPLPIEIIAEHVAMFINYATNNPGVIFEVTKIGCGLAGYKEEQIAPMFKDAPNNCLLPEGWRPTPNSVTAGVEKELVEALRNAPTKHRDECFKKNERGNYVLIACHPDCWERQRREALAAYEASRQSSGEGK